MVIPSPLTYGWPLDGPQFEHCVQSKLSMLIIFVPLSDASVDQPVRTLHSFVFQLMLSEWMLEKPAEFEKDWSMVPCPVGKRNLVIASGVSEDQTCVSVAGDKNISNYE